MAKKKDEVLYINGKYIVKSQKPLHNANFKKGDKPYKLGKKQIKITLVKSTIACLDNQKKTVEALGLKRVRDSKIFKDNDAIRGMVFKVKHLVEVTEVKGGND